MSGHGSGKSIEGLDKTRQWGHSPFWCLCQKLSLSVFTLIRLCYTKALEWSNLVPGPEAKSSSSEITNPTPFILSVNYKLALTKSIANDWTTKAFAICLYRDWTPCHYSCWPSTPPEGVQGGGRHSVLQGIWWDRSLDSWMFLGTEFMISILASPHI